MKIQGMDVAIDMMSSTDINDLLKKMNIKITYDEIYLKLQNCFNELEVADYIYDNNDIDTKIYPLETIDEIIITMCKTLEFDFLHYGIIENKIYDSMENDMSIELRLDLCYEQILEFLNSCKKFKLNNFDAIMYQVNDGFDLQTFINNYLDECREIANKKSKYIENMIVITREILKQFDIMNDFFVNDLNVMQATAYIIKGEDKIGDKMFHRIIKNCDDKAIITLQHAMAYMDINASRTKTILKNNMDILMKNKDVMDMVKEITSTI